MASNLPSRSLETAFIIGRSSPFRCAAAPTHSYIRHTHRGLALATRSSNEEAKEPPRWSYTPPEAKAPFRLRDLQEKKPLYKVNEDPAVLNKFYVRMLGNGGHKMISEELKWLAVTHKSFDQGRRGYNERLAFLGRRIVQLQASLALIQGGERSPNPHQSSADRIPFTHPSLTGLHNLSSNMKNYLTSKLKLSELARVYEAGEVIRWQPKRPARLRESGLDLVLANTMYAIVGAIALEKGGVVANEVAREALLIPLGFKVA